MGVKYYRFSLSWSRILPGGKLSMGKNVEGINHYHKLLHELKENGIEPFVTLFHWDLPNALEEEYMGFLSSKIVDDFVNYAELCFWEFGDRVKHWVTINELYRFTFAGYVEGNMAPGRGAKHEDGDPETEPYIVAYNLLNCHAAAYRKYQENFKDAQKGVVGITLDVNFFKPSNPDSEDDIKAVEYAYDFTLGWFLEPLTRGDWPENMQKFSTQSTQKHPKGRVLRKFSDDQRQKLIGSYDFLGINYYTASYARKPDTPATPDYVPTAPGYATDCQYQAKGENFKNEKIGEQAYPGSSEPPKSPGYYPGSWVYLCANELTELLQYIKKKYNVTKYFVITENGAPELNNPKQTYEQVKDDKFRLKYLKWHLEAIKRANSFSFSFGKRVKVMGYFVWSFMDSYEWYSGYGTRFGMIYVDYKNNLQRYPKNSAIWFKKFLSEKKGTFLKRTATDKEGEEEEAEDDDEVNGTTIELEGQAIDVVQKLKKAKA